MTTSHARATHSSSQQPTAAAAAAGPTSFHRTLRLFTEAKPQRLLAADAAMMTVKPGGRVEMKQKRWKKAEKVEKDEMKTS